MIWDGTRFRCGFTAHFFPGDLVLLQWIITGGRFKIKQYEDFQHSSSVSAWQIFCQTKVKPPMCLPPMVQRPKNRTHELGEGFWLSILSYDALMVKYVWPKKSTSWCTSCSVNVFKSGNRFSSPSPETLCGTSRGKVSLWRIQWDHKDFSVPFFAATQWYTVNFLKHRVISQFQTDSNSV